MNLAFKLVASPANAVQIKGWVSASANGDTIIFTLPAGYQPVTQQSIEAGANQINISTAGVVGLASNSVLGTNYLIDGLISLDI